MSSTLAVGPAMPALLTSTSRPPSLACASWNNRSTSASFATSASVSGFVFGSTSHMCTRAPASRNVCTIERPMPAPPAVTMTRKPLADNSIALDNSAGF